MRLLELLASGMSEGEVIQRLQTDPRFACYRDYVSQFDPDMVAVAAELICASGLYASQTNK
jgi:hypothetical protein